MDLRGTLALDFNSTVTLLFRRLDHTMLKAACYDKDATGWEYDAEAILSYALSLPRNRTACPYFCNFVIKLSPCLTTSAYCLFLSSGRFVSMIPLTRSIVQGIRSAAMNLARSLQQSLR